jgi:hypothetical protein
MWSMIAPAVLHLHFGDQKLIRCSITILGMASNFHKSCDQEAANNARHVFTFPIGARVSYQSQFLSILISLVKTHSCDRSLISFSLISRLAACIIGSSQFSKLRPLPRDSVSLTVSF